MVPKHGLERCSYNRHGAFRARSRRFARCSLWNGGTMKVQSLILVLLWSASFLPAQTRRNYTVDLENRNPAVGSLLIVVTQANPFDLPVGVAAFASGALIGDRVFLTAGHAVGPGLPELPPFIKAYVTFSPTALDKSTWIPVSRQVVHPSLRPCPPPAGCDPTTTGARTATSSITQSSVEAFDEAVLDRPAGTNAVPDVRRCPQMSGFQEKRRGPRSLTTTWEKMS